jgi:hypothetical protein
MRRSRLWLVATALAFGAWIGYLFYLTRGIERPAIHLSHPQFQMAEVVVVASLESKDGPATVREVVFTNNAAMGMGPGDQIQLPRLRSSLQKWFTDGGASEWDVPNEFIIPLRDVNRQGKDGPWTAEVVPLPPSPGLPHGTRIYPVTPNTMQELRSIHIGL